MPGGGGRTKARSMQYIQSSTLMTTSENSIQMSSSTRSPKAHTDSSTRLTDHLQIDHLQLYQLQIDHLQVVSWIMQILRIPPGSTREIIQIIQITQIRNISALKELDHGGIDCLYEVCKYPKARATEHAPRQGVGSGHPSPTPQWRGGVVKEGREVIKVSR